MKVAINQKSNKILKRKFMDNDVIYCEYPGCHSNFGLTFAHRHHRVDYKTLDELSDLNQVVLLCLKHHMDIEHDREATKELFNKLRGTDRLLLNRKEVIKELS